ncbi:uncharacterized protein LOC143076224 isoform X3 [Mytilus galloprovincialis]|uniref:uncharacterized protein LOC143076224 isoform X3 n=1 Tax=Mytilus galloprovincialis TaxID=29158 RepID=UPI003F7B9083
MGYILTVLNLLLQSVVRMIFTLPIGVSSKDHPKINDTKTDLNISSTALSLAIGIEHVYPVPNCSIIYGEKHLENLATVRINQSGMFYSAEVKLEYKSVKKKCPITANVICQFGGTRVTIISSNFNNCTSNYILDVLQSDMFVVQLCCIMVMLYCISIVLWSLRRNWGGILETCKELLSRELKDMRRPILAVLSVIASVTLSIQAKVISMKKVPQFEIDKEDIITPISLCLSSAALTPVSLGFISNPRTVSIRQGFKKAGENLMKRIKGWGCHVKSCMTNNINMTERILKHLNLLMKNISETDQKIIQIQTMQNPAVCYQCEKMYKHLFLNNFLYTFCCLYFSCLLL